MRVGIAGTGFMGRIHAAAWQHTNAELVGFVSGDMESAEATAAEFGGSPFATLAALLKQVDLIDICTPTHLHHALALEAAAAGVHIICEKPLARTLPEAREMIEAAEAAGVKLLVAHVVRFFPEYAAAQAQVAAGTIGDPAVIRLTRGTFQPKKRWDNWFLDPEKSGGMMLDLMIHDFDYARWVAGDVATVYAKNVASSFEAAEVDHGLAILTHKSGAISHIEGSWAYPPPLFRTKLEIAGSNGLIQHDSAVATAIASYKHEMTSQSAAPDVPLPRSPLLEDPYTSQIKAFYAHLVNNAPLRITAEDGYCALQIALAALESAASGQPIALED